MKLDKLIEQLQQQMTGNIKNTTTTSSLPSTSQQQHLYTQQSFNFLNYPCSTQNVVPFNEEDASQGLLAVGGCRQCSKTFTDRLSLIHHFADHFPNIFYSFEERPGDNISKIQHTQEEQQHPLKINFPQNSLLQGINGDIQMPVDIQQQSNDDQLGQLGMFLSLFGINPNSCSQQMLTNFLSSLQMPIKNNNNINFSMGMPSFGGETNSSFNFLNKEINNLNKDFINPLFDKKEEEKNEKTGNDLKIKLKDQQTNSNKKKKRHINNENNKESCKFIRNDEKHEEEKKSTESLLQQPIILSELPYHMCPHCCLTFAETANYKAHLEMHQQPLQINTAIDIGNFFGDLKNEKQQKQQFETKCPLCEMEFSNIFLLNEHIRLHSAHSCDICQKKFMTAFDLNLHMGTHTGFTYDCKDCGKCFPCRKTLAEHNRSHRIILSNSKINDKNNKTTFSENNQKQLIFELENSPKLQNFDQQQNNDERKKVKATKKGEKSRKNATLRALESSTPTFQNDLKTTNILPQNSPLNNNNSFINCTNIGDVEQNNDNNNNGNSAFGIMENILMRANSLLSVYGQNKILETVDLENEQKP